MLARPPHARADIRYDTVRSLETERRRGSDRPLGADASVDDIVKLHGIREPIVEETRAMPLASPREVSGVIPDITRKIADDDWLQSKFACATQNL
jgi:hypothetical protein